MKNLIYAGKEKYNILVLFSHQNPRQRTRISCLQCVHILCPKILDSAATYPLQF